MRKPFAHRVIQRIADFCGTIAFLVTQAVFFGVWIGYNLALQPFDPYPFPLLMLLVSLEAIFLSVFILISQNLSAAESDRRHHLDLQTNLLTEREMTALMRLVARMAEKMEVAADDLAEVESFAHETDPTAVLKQIVKAEHEHRERNGA